MAYIQDLVARWSASELARRISQHRERRMRCLKGIPRKRNWWRRYEDIGVKVANAETTILASALRRQRIIAEAQ